MEKKYKEIEFNIGSDIKSAVVKLINYAMNGEFVCGKFNGHTLYSDTVSFDSAYMEICGETYYDFLHKQEQAREDMERAEEEHKKSIPSLIEYWVGEGHKVLCKDKWEMWESCVPVRLNDLYKGMELGSCLDIIKTINEKSLEEAVKVIESQDHSGMSWSLVKSMVRDFSDKGEEFCNLLKY